MREPSDLPEPHLRIGAICERVLQEKDGVISLIRIVDRLIITAQGPNVPSELPAAQANITVVMSWAGGLGNHQAQVKVRAPGGEESRTPSMPFFLNALDSAQNFIVTLSIPVKQQGLYWVEFLLNGEPKGRVPWRVIYQPIELPSQPPEESS